MTAIKIEKDFYNEVREVISKKYKNIPPYVYGQLQNNYLIAITGKLKKFTTFI